MAGDSWLTEYDGCAAMGQEIMHKINERNKHERTSAQYTKASANIRTMIRQFSNEMNKLRQNLIRASTSYHLTQREVERRQAKLDELITKEKQIDQAFSDRTDHGGRTSLFGAGGSGSNPWGTTETEEDLRNMSVDHIRHQQRQMISQQDEGLDVLSKVIGRQKQMALDIGDEVDRQDEIIDDIHDHVDRTDERLIKETRHIKIVDRKSGSCAMWVVIVLLFIAIIVVVAIPYDGKA